MSSAHDRMITRRRMLALGTAAGLGALMPRQLLGMTGDDALAALGRGASRAGPFRMAAIGDSVMWGQGLLHEHKYATLVQRWLESPTQLGRTVELQFLARSGARIFEPDTIADAAAPPSETKPYFSREVPLDYPSVLEQARRVSAPDTVDLVLVTAGANDFGFTRILSPAMTPAVIEHEAKSRFGARTYDLLRQMLSASDPNRQFTNARIVVTGYYKAVSPQSVGIKVVDAIRTVAQATPEIREAIAGFFGVTGAVVTELLKAGFCLNASFRSLLIDNSAALLRSSNKWLQDAVDRANREFPAASGRRVEFVPVHFADENALGAPRSFIWNETDVDYAQAQRKPYCQSELASADILTKLKCEIAQVLHPNVLGSQAYANAINARLGSYLPSWKSETSA